MLFDVAEFHQVQVIKAINIIRGNRDFIASLVILPVQPDIPTSIRASRNFNRRPTSVLCSANSNVLLINKYMPDVHFILKRGGVGDHRKNPDGVVGMPGAIRTGHLPKTPARRYHYTNLLVIMTEL